MGIFGELMRDYVALVKKDGRRFPNVPASVQHGKIFIDDASLPVEEGDHIERELPNGLTERFLVLDRGFYKGMHDIPDHYQIQVRKESAIRTKPSESVVYNVTGPNARININSSDRSVNVVNVTTENLFVELRRALEGSDIAAPTRSAIASIVDEMEAARGKPSFIKHYRDFISAVADHVTIFAPFIPALTQLLQ
jgi:hypothetical protein